MLSFFDRHILYIWLKNVIKMKYKCNQYVIELNNGIIYNLKCIELVRKLQDTKSNIFIVKIYYMKGEKYEKVFKK